MSAGNGNSAGDVGLARPYEILDLGDFSPQMVPVFSLIRNGEKIVLEGWDINSEHTPGDIKAKANAIWRHYIKKTGPPITDEQGNRRLGEPDQPIYWFEMLRDAMLCLVPGLEVREATMIAGNNAEESSPPILILTRLGLLVPATEDQEDGPKDEATSPPDEPIGDESTSISSPSTGSRRRRG